jgi:hypothetical protein
MSKIVQVTVMAGVTIYPNPAKSVVKIAAPANATNITYRLIGSDGKIALKGTTTNLGGTAQIPVAGVVSGIYFLRVVANNTVQTYRVQIQH